jgi:hypothetical protein
LIICTTISACAVPPATPIMPATSTPLPTEPVKTQVPGTPTPTPEPTPGPCDCSADLVDCYDFCCPVQAQACLDYCRYQGKGDIHELDRDNDGTACDE